MKIGFATAAALATALTVVYAVRAEETPSMRQAGYTYEFLDDPLAAGGFDALDVHLKLRSNAVRGTLIRPRVQFVTEMLKSVENM